MKNLKTRAEMVEILIEEDINSIKKSLEYGDVSFLDSVLRGNAGWKQYSELSDEEIEIEYNEYLNSNEDEIASGYAQMMDEQFDNRG